MKNYDVIIIGAGPAGSTLARFAVDKKIAIFDRRPLDREYNSGDLLKSCGGLLSPRTQKFLSENEIVVPDYVLDKDQYTHVKTTDFDIAVTRKYKRNYININREKFDRFLLDDLTGIDKYFGTWVKSVEYKNNMYVINGEFTAPVLVGADGASSVVRRRLFPELKLKTYASIQEVFDNKCVDGYECYFDKKTSDYYGWALNKNNRTYFGYLIPAGKDARAKYDSFKSKRGFNQDSTMEGTTLVRPGLFHPVTCKDNVFLIGEAGGYISPSSAEGISYAMRTAKVLAESDFDEIVFKNKMRKIQIEIFIKKLKSIPMYTPSLRHIIMRGSIFSK